MMTTGGKCSRPKANSRYFGRTAKLEHELRLARNQDHRNRSKLVTLETECCAQGTCNELLQKMSAADLARQRTMEENAALAQKLNRRESPSNRVARGRAPRSNRRL